MEAHAWDWSRILEATVKADAAAGTTESRQTVFIKEVRTPPDKARGAHAHPYRQSSYDPDLLWRDSTGRTVRRRMHWSA